MFIKCLKFKLPKKIYFENEILSTITISNSHSDIFKKKIQEYQIYLKSNQEEWEALENSMNAELIRTHKISERYLIQLNEKDNNLQSVEITLESMKEENIRLKTDKNKVIFLIKELFN